VQAIQDVQAYEQNESEATMNGIDNSVARRYHFFFAMRYVTAQPAVAAQHGVGETVWMSGKEVGFLAKGPAGVGDKIALYIDWPVLLQGEVPLQLIVTAVIVQRSGPLSVARMSKHEFRTRGAQSSAAAWQQHMPLSDWATHPARYIPMSKTAGSAPPRQPALASAMG